MKYAPWFKLWASDYMTDRDVDELPLEAQAILIRIWCVQWLEGGIPPEPEEIARKCRVSILHVQKHMQNLMQFFYTDASGLLMSARMESERSKSKITSKARSDSAKLRWNKGVSAFAYANDHANGHAKCDAKSMLSEPEPEPEPDKRSKTKPHFTLPEDIPVDAWNGWIEMRKKKRAAPTVRAMEQAVNKLRELRRDGNNSAEVLDQSTFNSWQGLFPIREQGGNRNGSRPNPALEALRKAAGRQD